MRKILFLIITMTTFVLINLNGYANASLPSPKSSTQTLDRIIAVVNNDVITQQEFNAAMSRVIQNFQSQHAPMPPQTQLKQEVLNQLIYKKLQLQLIKRAKIKVTNTQVSDAIKRIAERNHVSVKSALEHMHAAGLTRKVLRQQIAISQLQHQAVMKDINVTEADVDKIMQEYKQHQQNQTLYHVADYLVPLQNSSSSTEIAKAKQKIKSLRTAILSGKQNNYNDLGWQAAANLPDVFIRQLTKLKPGQVSQPILAGNGFHIIKLLGVHSDDINTFTRARAHEIATQIQVHKALKKWLAQLRSSSYVKVLTPQ